MILISADKIADVDDAILWASVEFCIQCEAYLRNNFNRDNIDIADLSEVSRIKGDMLWVVGHGAPHGIQVEGSPSRLISWSQFGLLLAPLPQSIKDIYFTSCYAAAGAGPQRGIQRVWNAVQPHGVKVHGYVGPVVSNIATGPVQVVNDNPSIQPMVDEQNKLISKLAPNQKLKSWRMNNPSASRSKTAEAAAEVNWQFYEEFTSVFNQNNFFYGPLTQGAQEVTVP